MRFEKMITCIHRNGCETTLLYETDSQKSYVYDNECEITLVELETNNPIGEFIEMFSYDDFEITYLNDVLEIKEELEVGAYDKELKAYWLEQLALQ